MDITLEPTLAPNEFKVVEWDSTFFLIHKDRISIDDAKQIIVSYVETSAMDAYLKLIRHKRQEILLATRDAE